MRFKQFSLYFLIGIIISPAAISQIGSETTGPVEIIQKLEQAGVFEVPDFEFTSEYDGYRSYDHLQGLFFDALPYHGDSTKVFCWYGIPENIPDGSKVPAVVLVHGGGGTVFPDWVKKWTDRGYAAISIALEGQVAGAKDADNGWPTHFYSGPKRTAFFADLQTENTEDVWFYHAVADVILANSLIRSFPEVDTTNIGITGISWGGILAPVIAGIDLRFDFAIPVYGCGYLQDSPLYSRQLGRISAAAQAEYLRSWDPSNYIPLISAPTLFVNGTNDCHFTMNCFTRSYKALNVEKYLRVEHNMGHGHAPGWRPESIYQFADYITGKASMPISFKFETLANKQRVNYSYEGELETASLYYTTDTSDWDCENYEWIEMPVELDTAVHCLCARIPSDAQYYFVNGLSQEGILHSSSMRKVEDDPAYATFPEFSWDHVPLYMHGRKSTAFTQEELEYLAEFPILTLEKTTGSTTYGSSEKGAVEAGRAIKAINPDTKVLFYWNAMLNYSSYDAKAEVDAMPGAFLEDATGYTLLHLDKREVYDLSNINVREWWLDLCVEMTGKEEIDGVFVDACIKAVTPGYLQAQVGAGKKQAVLDGYNTMMTEMNLRMDSSKLKLANMIRASLPDAGLEYMHSFDGSYLEKFEGDPSYLAKGIKATQTAAREGKMIAFCMGGEDAIPESLSIDDKGHILTDSALQARLDYSLAMYLVCAEEYSYFLMHDGYNVNPGGSALWLTRFAEYDRPLGPPRGQAEKSGYIYTRQFENAGVYLDIGKGEGRINWGSNSIPYPPDNDPEQKKLTLRFVLGESNSPSYVRGARIELDTLTSLSNDAGQALFLLDSGSYQYSITAPGFFPIDSSIHMLKDTTVQISIKSTTAEVKFRLKEGDTPLANADVLLNGIAIQTNTVGLAVLEDLPVNEEYSYSIGKEGYEVISGNFLLVKDTTINLKLTAITGMDLDHGALLRIYPVPAGDYLVIESGEEMLEIRLVDLTGRVWFFKTVSGKESRIELPPVFPHIGILKVLFRDGSVHTKRVIGN